MVSFDEVSDWFTSWLKGSKKHEPRKEPKVEEPKRKPKPSPKTKSAEEIFREFEWYGRPIYGNKVKTPPKTVYVDPNLVEGYRIFGIDETASKADIKSRFHALAKKYHPDYNKSPRAAQSFINLKKWYEYLVKHHVQKEN
jgi:DnaJ-class molecular chaperone